MNATDDLPKPVEAALAAFVAALREVFADDLVGVVLFGSAAEARLRPTSDVNVVVVLGAGETARLAAIGEAYRLAHAAIRLSAMFIREAEIAAASDAFAVKFADIAARHRVLLGRNPFAALAVSRESALWRSRQVSLNLLLRLRERLALSANFPEQLAVAAADAVGPLRACAATLLSLESGAELTPRDALRRLADEEGETPALAAIVEARESGRVPQAGGVATIGSAIALAAAIQARAERLS